MPILLSRNFSQLPVLESTGLPELGQLELRFIELFSHSFESCLVALNFFLQVRRSRRFPLSLSLQLPQLSDFRILLLDHLGESFVLIVAVLQIEGQLSGLVLCILQPEYLGVLAENFSVESLNFYLQDFQVLLAAALRVIAQLLQFCFVLAHLIHQLGDFSIFLFQE